MEYRKWRRSTWFKYGQKDQRESKNTNIIKRYMLILLKKLRKLHMVDLCMNEEATINFVHKCM